MAEGGSSGGGVSLLGVLQIVFLVLKLCGLVNWSWWVVLLPTWISLAIGVVALLVISITIMMLHYLDKWRA